MTLARLFLKRQMPAQAVDEVALLHEVATGFAGVELAGLSREVLAGVTRERGVDVATTLLYDRIRRSPQHGPFIRAVEAREPDIGALPQLRGKLLIAPALFYREFPEFGGDGWLIQQIARRFGLEVALFPLPSAGSIRESVPIIQETLAREPDGSVIIVSLSKGSAEVGLALAAGEPTTRKVRAWLSICGLLRGFPTFNVYFEESRFRAFWRGVIGLYFRYMGGQQAAITDLMHGPGTLLDAPPVAPPGVPTLSVLGFPLRSHLSGTLKNRHRQLAPRGPNDGFGLLRDGMVEGSLVYPVWAANHYFRFPGSARLLYQLFLHLAEEHPRG